jgi:hypothetical protein
MMARMHRRITTIALAAALLAASTAEAAAPSITLAPAAGKAGTRIVLRGAGWAQIEFCKPRVILAVDDVVFARARLDGHGRFAVRWRIPDFARGNHRIYATQRCESGKDGSPRPVTRHVELRVTA